MNSQSFPAALYEDLFVSHQATSPVIGAFGQLPHPLSRAGGGGTPTSPTECRADSNTERPNVSQLYSNSQLKNQNPNEFYSCQPDRALRQVTDVQHPSGPTPPGFYNLPILRAPESTCSKLTSAIKKDSFSPRSNFLMASMRYV